MSRYRVALAKHEVSLIDADAAPALDALRRGDIDLALVFNYNVAQLIDPSEADLTEILVEPIYAVLPAAHRLGAATEPHSIERASRRILDPVLRRILRPPA